MKFLKAIRKAKGLTQAQLAEFLHTSPSTVSVWEIGKGVPRIGQMVKMCRIFDCLPSDFFETPQCEAACVYIPVFSQSVPCHVSFEKTSKNNPHFPFHFGIRLCEDLSPRLKNGDVCFFTMDNAAAEGDVVLCCDENLNESLVPSYIPQKGITPVAVCHFARMTV